MKFQKYISEGAPIGPDYKQATRTVPLEEEDGILHIRKYCMDAFNLYKTAKQGMWRGSMQRDMGRYLYINPKQHVRWSANTANYYTWWIEHSKRWSKYPKRHQSMIGTTTYDSAYAGGKYLVLPYNGSYIGVCPRDDFWPSFSNTNPTSDLNDFNIGLIDFIGDVIGDHKIRYAKSLQDFLNVVREFDKVWPTKDEYAYQHGVFSHEGKQVIFDFVRSKTTMEKYLDIILDPDENDFALVKAGDDLPREERELWTDGESILVDARWLIENYTNFVNAVEGK